MEKRFLESEERRFPRSLFWGLVVLAYLFAIAVRYYWVDWASGYPQFFWNGQLMINTNDGYFWAEGARDILAGFHQTGDLSPIHEPIARLTAFLTSILPFAFETVILWMPAVFGSLIVVPIMLIAREFRQDLAGFVAALLGGIAWSYYNRTMAGYYDTDMLTIVLPTFVLWGLIHAMLHRRDHWLLTLAALMLVYQWWYPSAAPLDTAFAGVVLLYTLLFERRERYNYKLLLFMVVTVTPIPVWVRIVLLLGLYGWFRFDRERSERLVLPLLGAAALLFVLFGGLEPVWYQIKGYLLRESANAVTADRLNLHFYAVSKTVREAGQIPFGLFANRISGSPSTFLLSVIGYLALVWRYRVMWLALPMLGLGFLAMQGGLRFTVYAVPVCALGAGYLVAWFAGRLAGYAAAGRGRHMLRYAAAAAVTLLILWPNIRHVEIYKVPTVFSKSEVEVLDRLRAIAGREDYVLTWWDYGYPVRYYSDVKTLIDGGKHSGDVNFPVSFALLRPQAASAAMARLSVEYTERELREAPQGPLLEVMMRERGYDDPDLFLTLLEDADFSLPRKSREIYYFLPLRLLNILPTVAVFSRIDLRTGKEKRQPFFYLSRRFVKTGAMYDLGNGLLFDARRGVVRFGKNAVLLHSYLVTYFGADGKVHTLERVVDSRGSLYLIHLKNRRRFVLVDREFFRSTYIQLGLLGRYDPELFEPVISSPAAMIYRLKR